MLNLINIIPLLLFTKMRVVSWFVGQDFNNNFLPENISWDIYTHITSGNPYVDSNGFAYCNLTNQPITKKLLELGKKNNVIIQWHLGIDYPLTNKTNYLKNYLSSIKLACEECGIGGIEVDYEFGTSFLEKLGIVTHKDSNRYSNFLSKIKKSVGKNILVSADIDAWTLSLNDYFLGVFPWINAKTLNTDIDFVNTMSYHWNKYGSIINWKENIFALKYFYKYNLSKVNLGIGYFSKYRINKRLSEPTWMFLSKQCPNINPSLNVCNNINFVGKEMNQKIGELAVKEGLGGVFPWAANYDSVEFNNSLIHWLNKGLHI